jgi:hypothetical protein
MFDISKRNGVGGGAVLCNSSAFKQFDGNGSEFRPRQNWIHRSIATYGWWSYGGSFPVVRRILLGKGDFFCAASEPTFVSDGKWIFYRRRQRHHFHSLKSHYFLLVYFAPLSQFIGYIASNGRITAFIWHRHILTQIVQLSLESYCILVSLYDKNQNRHIADLIENTGIFFRKVAYSEYGLPTEMF